MTLSSSNGIEASELCDKRLSNALCFGRSASADQKRDSKEYYFLMV